MRNPSTATRGGQVNVHLDTALNWLDVGFSTLPPNEDGSKSPLADVLKPDGTGYTWNPYQEAPADRGHVESWYHNGRTGNGVATGVGGLELFEFDDRATYELFKEAARAAGLADLVELIEAGYLEETPGGGIHWFYVCDEIRPSTKLAVRPTPTEENPHKRKTLIETKGQGGFAVVAPSNGRVHPSGGAYRLLRGRPDLIARIPASNRQALWDLAETFDEVEAPEIQEASRQAQRAPSDGPRPGDDYESQNSWDDILVPLGWVKCYTRGDVAYWRRPEKDRGISATTGHCKGLYVFSSSTSFEPRRSYTKFGAYAHLHHAGDHKAAAKELAKQGYGQQEAKRSSGAAAPPPSGAGQGASSTDAIDYSSLTESELGVEWAKDIKDEPIEWIDHLRLASGKLHITAGAGGTGKSQQVIAEVAAITTGGKFPDGSPCLRSGVVLILAAEDGKADTIVPRLRAAGADMSKVAILKTTLTIKGKNGKPDLIDFVNFQNLPYWEALFSKIKPVLLVADPIPAFMGRDVNDHRNADVRRVLEPFVELLERHNVAMEAITHVGKSVKDKTATDQILGSVAYTNLARRVNITWIDPETPKRFIVTNPKLTVGPTQPAMAYTIEEFTYEKDGKTIATSRCKFEDATFEADEFELAQGQKGAHRGKRRGPDPVKLTELVHFLLGFLKGKGPVHLGEIGQAAGEKGFIGKQVEDDKTGKTRWSNFTALYDAQKRIPDLPPPDDGWMVATSQDDPELRSINGKARWQLRKTKSNMDVIVETVAARQGTPIEAVDGGRVTGGRAVVPGHVEPGGF
jgi:RecA-family ATPase